MKTILTALALSLLAAGPAWAADGMPSAADRAFLVKEARGSAFETEISQLAAGKASRPEVRSYAESVVHDHDNFNAALEKLGKTQGVELPMAPDAADAAKLKALQALSGPAFDAAYLGDMMEVNAEDQRDDAKQKRETKDQAISDFLSAFSGMDARHEKGARDLRKAG